MSEHKQSIALESGAKEEDTVKRVRTLGTVQLRHHETNEVILIPTPSNDPNDPLNWYVYTFLDFQISLSN